MKSKIGLDLLKRVTNWAKSLAVDAPVLVRSEWSVRVNRGIVETLKLERLNACRLSSVRFQCSTNLLRLNWFCMETNRVSLKNQCQYPKMQ